MTQFGRPGWETKSARSLFATIMAGRCTTGKAGRRCGPGCLERGSGQSDHESGERLALALAATIT
jgi:hypothetical protein